MVLKLYFRFSLWGSTEPPEPSLDPPQDLTRMVMAAVIVMLERIMPCMFHASTQPDTLSMRDAFYAAQWQRKMENRRQPYYLFSFKIFIK